MAYRKLRPPLALEPLADGGERSSALVVFTEDHSFPDFAPAWVSQLEGHYHLLWLRPPLPPSSQIPSIAAAVQRHCDYKGLKRLTVMGTGSSASLAMAVAISAPRAVRRLVVIDAASRVRPGLITRTVDWIEENLPLGFPFRALTKDFDVRSNLHRIHCPTLILTSAAAGQYLHQQSALLASRIPNAWQVHLQGQWQSPDGTLSEELRRLFLEFGQVPVKRPQKILGQK